MPKLTIADATSIIDALQTPMHDPPPKETLQRRLHMVRARWHTKLKYNLIPIDWREYWFARIERARVRWKKQEARERQEARKAREAADVG